MRNRALDYAIVISLVGFSFFGGRLQGKRASDKWWEAQPPEKVFEPLQVDDYDAVLSNFIVQLPAPWTAPSPFLSIPKDGPRIFAQFIDFRDSPDSGCHLIPKKAEKL